MIGKECIEKLFAKQLLNIDSEQLRDKVISIWYMACHRGGWLSLEELKQVPFTLLVDTKNINIIEHTIAVTEGALALAKTQINSYCTIPYEVNMDRLIAGALLHDVGKLLEIEKDNFGRFVKSRNGMCIRHPISGAILASEEGLEDELINIIAYHAKEGIEEHRVIEAIIIHHADMAAFNPVLMMSKNQIIK